MVRNSRNNLRFEQLEEKKMLAGDVLVSVVNGALVIEGDELDNQIAVSSGPQPGEYLVRGLDGTVVSLADGGAEPTDPAPGVPEIGVVVSGVERGARIFMHEGDDSVEISDAHFNGNVIVGTGSGADHVTVGLPREVGPGPVPAGLEEGGDNGGALPGVRVRGSLIIRTGDDADTVRLGGRPMDDPNAPLNGTDEEDSARPQPTLGVGRSVIVGLGAGEDHLAVDAVHAGLGIMAFGGADSDTMDVANTHTRLLSLQGGRGDAVDTVHLNHVYANLASIGTGAGDDEVSIVDSAFGMLGVRTGAGNDTVSVGGTSARLAMFFGGAGAEDTFRASFHYL